MPLNREVPTDATSTNRHPLNHFWGTVEDINEVARAQRNDPNKTTNYIVFSMSQLEIIKANEPFNFPVAIIEIPEINIPNTPWEVFKTSLRTCGFSGLLNDIIGKRVRWEWAPAVLNQRKQTGVSPAGAPVYTYVNEDSFCWQIVEIEGTENTSNRLLDTACDIADGKTDSEFKTAFMSNGDIRGLTGYSDLLVAVAGNTALSTLVSAGKLRVDNGVYSKV